MTRLPAVILAACLLTCPPSLLAGSSNSLLDVSPDGARLVVANPDNGTITVVDVNGRKKIHEIAVGEKPESVSWVGKSSLAVATVYHQDLLVFIDTAAGKVVHKLTVPDEPYGVVVTRDGSRAYISHEYPGLVSEIDLKEKKILRQMPVGPFVRGLCLSPDEKRVYVTEFYTAALHALDLASGKVVDSWKGISTDNLARHVVVHPKRPKAYLAHLRSRVDVNHGAGSIFPQLTVYDLKPGEGKRRASFGMDTFNGVYVTANPWESAISSDGKHMVVIYAATNDMNLLTTVDDDYQEISRQGLPSRTGQNPRAVRFSPDDKTFFVYNAMDFAVGIHRTESGRLVESIKVCDPPKSKEWVRGKVLFNTALPPLTTRRWIACASCHPDGHSDGRVWQNPEGKRRTPHMFGMAHTHPIHWSADRDEVQDFEYTIRGPLMGGRGLYNGSLKPKFNFKPVELEMDLSGKSADLDALAIYCNSFEFTSLSPHALGPGKLSESAERGKKLFFSEAVGCAKCHSGPYYTDSNLKTRPLHDVGTGNDDPTEKMGPKYDTPTLLGAYRTPPYLHHGKAKTLHEVLTTFNKGDRHGKTSHLKPAEIDDLVAFLKSLPYELPPRETPNTVKYRLIQAKKD